MKFDRKRGWAVLLLASSLSLGLTGCSTIGVRPWEHDLLAKKGMQLNVAPNLTAFHEHVEFSKEGSAGGRSFDGGGCGCN